MKTILEAIQDAQLRVDELQEQEYRPELDPIFEALKLITEVSRSMAVAARYHKVRKDFIEMRAKYEGVPKWLQKGVTLSEMWEDSKNID